ncbi:hypothetical protein NP493_1239g00032 [Ridgeia piscesae]|uniref:Ig-like domain-containing protein n=1 Tax=Ridgeia piscesae TaxID=27915 RepID=A0AAD9KAT9_RIDPI|nr:hypothetical protein NP493_1239g00032 [Ridgeia piscesae]
MSHDCQSCDILNENSFLEPEVSCVKSVLKLQRGKTNFGCCNCSHLMPTSGLLHSPPCLALLSSPPPLPPSSLQFLEHVMVSVFMAGRKGNVCAMSIPGADSGMGGKHLSTLIFIPVLDMTLILPASAQRPTDHHLYLGGHSVVVDKPYNITCHADNGKPAANITWSTDGVEITEKVSFSFTTKPDGKRQDAVGILEITPRKTDQARSIRCDVRNAAMNFPKWSEAHLEVLYPPLVTMRLVATKKIKEFSSVRFTCDAVGNPNDITWKWYKGDAVVSGATRNVLDIEVVLRDLHGKNIVCEATNGVGSMQQKQTLNVEYGPKFMSKSNYVSADIGDDATLTCQVDSNPPPAIIWTRKQSPRILSSSSIFSISDVTQDDFGTYTCLASVIGFPEITMDVKLLQKGPPKVVSMDKQYAKFGELGLVECGIESVPAPTAILWTRDGQPLDWASLDRYELKTEDMPTGKRSIIQIQSVQAGDFGIYNCSVENGYGHDYKTITFYKQEVVAVAYILAGVLTGVLIIIAVAVGVFLYQRRKSLNSESGSESSASSIGKKKEGLDVPMDYKNEHFGSTVEAWRQDCDPRFYRHSADYDELSYPPKDARGVNPDYPDGFGNYGYNTDYRRDYGTYPGTGGKMYAPRYEPGYAASYTSDPYRTYPAPRSDYEATLDVSRLSTNV